MTSLNQWLSGPRIKTIVSVVVLLLIGVLLVIGWLNQPASTRGNDNGAVGGDTSTTQPASKSSTGQQSTRGSTDPESGLRWIDEASLPQQAKETLALIDRGGPYPYPRDGVVFENREGILPKKPRGYYHEYTVVTPGESDRGARRIVTGSEGEFYWTADHYDSFMRVRRTT